MDDFLVKSEPRTIAFMLITLVLLLCTIQLLYLLWPQVKQYRDYSSSFKILRQAADSSMGLEQQLEIATDEVNKLSYQLHGDMAGLPEKQMESYIIGRLQKVSWGTDVELASITPGRGKQVQMFQESLFEVQINATYFNFFKWLQTINDELGYIVVKKFEIRPLGSKSNENPELNITLTLVSYRLIRNA